MSSYDHLFKDLKQDLVDLIPAFGEDYESNELLHLYLDNKRPITFNEETFLQKTEENESEFVKGKFESILKIYQKIQRI